MKKNFGRIFWGICVLILGVALILYATGVIETVFFAGWWSLFLILPGIAMLCKRGCRAGGVVLVLLGLYFLLKEQNIISFGLSWPLVLGILLIYAGIVVLFGWLFHPKARPARAQETTFFQNGSVDFHDKPSYDAVFSRCDVTNSSKALKEAGGNAVFGQLNLDFSGVQASGNPAHLPQRRVRKGHHPAALQHPAGGKRVSCLRRGKKRRLAFRRPQSALIYGGCGGGFRRGGNSFKIVFWGTMIPKRAMV